MQWQGKQTSNLAKPRGLLPAMENKLQNKTVNKVIIIVIVEKHRSDIEARTGSAVAGNSTHQQKQLIQFIVEKSEED